MKNFRIDRLFFPDPSPSNISGFSGAHFLYQFKDLLCPFFNGGEHWQLVSCLNIVERRMFQTYKKKKKHLEKRNKKPGGKTLTNDRYCTDII